MSRWFLLFIVAVSFPVCAVDEKEECAIANMVKNSSLSREEILEDYKTGCASGNTYKMRICAAYGFYEADVDLNDTYKKVKGKLSKEQQDLLIKAQRAWITYRDATCLYETSFGGSADGMYYSSCRETLTRERTKRLIENSPNQEE